jgi:RNA polymerase sigma-70 factor (ECF subfamily)
MTSPISAEIPVVAVNPLRNGPVAAEIEVDARPSFEAFYAQCRDSVARAVALAIGDPDLAVDSTDEAMVRAYQRWSSVGTLELPAGWVYRVAINCSRSRMRRVARKARHVVTGVIGRDTHTDVPFADHIGDSDLARALDTLPMDRRSVVVLRVLLQFSEQECAAALDIRPGTAKSRLHRGLSQLRDAVPHLAPDIDALVDDGP